MERLLDDGPNLRWKATWPPDAGELLTRRAAAIEERHHPAVVLEGSGTFVADDAGSLHLPDTGVPADVLWTDSLPCRSPRRFAVVDARGRVAWTHKGDEETSLLVIASRSTPLPYLARLRQERIPYCSPVPAGWI
jgi:2,5-diamino-6-(ribosylamino)-4(3H)-pyrimidinone 5'-phosphate reductase